MAFLCCWGNILGNHVPKADFTLSEKIDSVLITDPWVDHFLIFWSLGQDFKAPGDPLRLCCSCQSNCSLQSSHSCSIKTSRTISAVELRIFTPMFLLCPYSGLTRPGLGTQLITQWERQYLTLEDMSFYYLCPSLASVWIIGNWVYSSKQWAWRLG